MKLTSEQKKAIECDCNAFITACPGSGKTRTLIAKLIRCIDEIRDTSRRIACITYTNAGVYEIESRLVTYGRTGDENYCEISTIHAFCLDNVLRYFYWRLPDYAKGFTILPSDSEKYREIVSSICSDYRLQLKARDNFELLNREPDGTPIVPWPLTIEIATDFWNRLQQERFIDFPNIIYLSYRLMSEWPNIAYAIASRFAWILVDEFQDTSALQVEILKLVANINRTKFFLVGDPYQSIYGFAGARPKLMEEFVDRIGAQRDFKLVTNFRSSEKVIFHAEKLCPRSPAMNAGGNSALFIEEPQYFHVNNIFEGITEHFIPKIKELRIDYGQSAILAPWWIKLLHLGRRLRDYGVPIIGPGARPYKRTHLFALLAEQICAYIEHPQSSLIRQIERELFILLNNVTNSFNFNVYTYAGRTTVYRLLRKGEELRRRDEGGIPWLESAARAFATILCKNEFLPESCVHLLIESVEDMKNDMRRYMTEAEVTELSVADLGMFASSKHNMQLRTIHRAKGLEFDAVAVIDLHDGRIPHFSVSTAEELAEARRLFYVAITRARRILMYFTDDEDSRNSPCPFLGRNGLEVR